MVVSVPAGVSLGEVDRQNTRHGGRVQAGVRGLGHPLTNLGVVVVKCEDMCSWELVVFTTNCLGHLVCGGQFLGHSLAPLLPLLHRTV